MTAGRFPDEFLWGAAISAHQVEGNNVNDWSEWEKANAERWSRDITRKDSFGCGPLTAQEWAAAEKYIRDPANYKSGEAVAHYEHWRKDIQLAKKLHLNALRFSVEWSRVQPEADRFDETAINHYVNFAEELVANGIKPIITLHHFTNPLWFVEQGGWEAKSAALVFSGYVKKVVQAIKNAGVTSPMYIILNEPEVYAVQGWAFGVWPPQKRRYFKAYKVTSNLIQAHKLCYETIKSIEPTAQVGSTVHVIDFEAKRNVVYPLNRLAIRAGNMLFASRFRKEVHKSSDLTAINQYLHCVVDVTKILSNRGLFKNDPDEPRTDMGWFIHPPSMYRVLKGLPRDKPILIAENGFAFRDDVKREKYLQLYVAEVQRAINEGVPVIGYMHWSLLDGFEWPIAGWWAKFGLVAVDRKTMRRTLKPSAELYSRIIQANQRINV